MCYAALVLFFSLFGNSNLACTVLSKDSGYSGDALQSAVASNKPQRKFLPNGIQVSKGSLVLQVTALAENLLRVRETPTGEFSEDASWAVPEEIRRQSVRVLPEEFTDTAGFRTSMIRVGIDLASLRLTVSDLEGNVLQEDDADWPAEFHGTAFRLYKKMPFDEHYFGLGDKTGPLDHRGQAFRLWNTDAFRFQETTDPIYKSIPFFLTVREGRSLGVFLDNTWPSSFDFGRTERNVYSFGAEGGPVNYYLWYGPEPKDVVKTYAWLTGLPPLPPLWAFGFQQSRFSYESEEKVRSIASKLRADKIPADVLYLDIDYQFEHRPFTVDKERFPHFTQMLADLKRENFHVVAITDLHIARVGHDYFPYDSGIAGDHFVKNADGSVYEGTVWPGPAVFPEFTRQQSRLWWGTLYKDFVSQGISGFWNDMNEPSIFQTPTLTMPENVQHRIAEPGFKPRTASHREIHNVFGMENSRATYEGLRKLNNDVRPFVLTRATYAGGQRFAATWTGDNTSSWNHLRLATPMILNLGLSGFGLCGADVGGFIGTPGPELLTRWTEIASFQPIDRNHTDKGSGDKEVWVHGPEQEAIRRHYIEERYRLLPYLYTAAEELSRTGVPIVRPLFLEFPHATADSHPLDIDAGTEFLFGPDLLVAPPPFAEQPDAYHVLLPPGIWYDYWTGEVIEATRQELKASPRDPVVQPKLDTLPIYVREGTILPMQPLTQSTEEVPQGPLTLRVYPGKDCKGTLYQDDGKTFAYQRGEFLRMEFSCSATESGVAVRIGAHQGTYPSWWRQIHLEVFGWNTASAVVVINGKSFQPAVAVDAGRHLLSFDIPDGGHGDTLEIRGAN